MKLDPDVTTEKHYDVYDESGETIGEIIDWGPDEFGMCTEYHHFSTDVVGGGDMTVSECLEELRYLQAEYFRFYS